MSMKKVNQHTVIRTKLQEQEEEQGEQEVRCGDPSQPKGNHPQESLLNQI